MIQISDEVRVAHRGLAVGYLELRGLAYRDPDGLDGQTEEIEAELRRRFGAATRDDIQQIEPLKSYRAYYDRYRKTYPVLLQIESVAQKGRSIAAPDPIVRAMFMAELKNMLLTAGHDLGKVKGQLRLEVAAPEARYILIGGAEKKVLSGDVIMADADGIIASVIYGPDSRTRLEAETDRALFVAYAPESCGLDELCRHLGDIESYVKLACPRSERAALDTLRL